MVDINIEAIKQAIVKDFGKTNIDSKAFNSYILDKYARLLYKLYKKAEKK